VDFWELGLSSSEQPVEFLSNILQETAQLIVTNQLLTLHDHPQTDELKEYFNRTLKQGTSEQGSKD